MRDRSEHVVQIVWGTRPVCVADIATRLQRSLQVLADCGGDLAGPWSRDYSTPIDSRDLDAIRDQVEAEPARDDVGDASPERGYVPSLTIGNWHAAQSEATELGNIRVSANSGPLASTCILTFRGPRLSAQVQEHAQRLVKGLARAWQPDTVTLTDGYLLDERRDWLPSPAPGRSFAPWGYHAWMSDRFARELDHVEGATTSKFGAGTILVADSWDTARTARTWQALVESRRIRGIRFGEAQDTLPQF